VLFKVVTTEKQFDINVDKLPLKQGTLPEAELRTRPTTPRPCVRWRPSGGQGGGGHVREDFVEKGVSGATAHRGWPI
jgi:hypothetical protein